MKKNEEFENALDERKITKGTKVYSKRKDKSKFDVGIVESIYKKREDPRDPAMKHDSLRAERNHTKYRDNLLTWPAAPRHRPHGTHQHPAPHLHRSIKDASIGVAELQ